MRDRNISWAGGHLAHVALLLAAVALLWVAPATATEGPEPVGSVRTLDGSATIVRQGTEIPASLGDRLFADDIVITSEGGAIGIVLRDDTLVSMGPSSELGMTEFDFRPDDSAFSIVMNFVKGTFVYVSGRIGKLSPESVKVETPVGAIAVRGTKFLVKIV